MDRLSISDIMWNLNSGFREISFKDAELLLIKREQQLKSEKFAMEEKYNGVLKYNEALKNKCDNLRKENNEEVRLRRELREKLHAKESEVKRARTKIRFLETENATERRRAKDSERREKEAIEENTMLLAKIKGLEKEKAEAQRQERDVRGEIEKHLQKIECLEKEKEEALSEAENTKNIFDRFKRRIDSLLEDSSLNAYDRDVEERLNTKMKEESDWQSSSSPLMLSGKITDLSLMVSGEPTNTTTNGINDIDSDSKWVYPLNGLKRKRDSSRSPSLRVVDEGNDKNINQKHESEPHVFKSGDLSNGPANLSLLAVASNTSWHFEADMLSAIDKNPVLAMEAVCALYRQLISHGNLSSGSAFLENRGFNSLYVFRGTTLAEFLLNGDPQGDMKKSLKELQLHDSKGLDDCKKIASTHSRQLFEIYQRQDDPFYGPK